MKFGIFALCCLVASAAALDYDTRLEVPTTFNQEFINTILRHVHEPLIFEEYHQFTFKPLIDPSRYVSKEVYQNRIYRFFDLYEHGLLLPRGRVGTLFGQKFTEQTGLLFNLFYYSIDLPTLYQNVIWARENVNELMFIHALHLAVFHRPDIKDIVFPPLYEIIPSHFFNANALQKGIDYKLAGLEKINSTFTVYTDYTSRYYLDKFNEQRMAYFTEDIGLNTFYYYFYMRYPFFLGGRYNSVDMKIFGFDKEPVGELWFYMHQQLLARYYLERVSNDLGEIRQITWIKGIKTGYWPMLRYKNGLEFSYRSNYYGIENMDTDFLDVVYDWEERIRQMIDSGYITLKDQKYSIHDPKFLDILGNLVTGNVEETRFYRYVLVFYHLLAGGRGTVKMDSYYYAPSTLEHFETVLRDPVFYQMYQRIIRFYLQYKDQLPTYQTEDLYVPVKVEDVFVSPLQTYFEYETVDVSNTVNIDIVEPKLKYKFLIRQPRLNYEPFEVKLSLNAETAGDYTIRFFIGPKVLNRYNLNMFRQYFFELDHFIYKLNTGKNTVVRQSHEFLYFFKDLVRYSQGVHGEFNSEHFNQYLVEYGFPARLMLPKGTPGGLPFTFYVIVHKNDDKQALGFPFDRKIDVLDFFVPNMYFKDVIIFQKVDYNVFAPSPLNSIYYNDMIPMPSIRVPLNVEYYKDDQLDQYFWHHNDVYRVWYQKYMPKSFHQPAQFKKSVNYEKTVPYYTKTIGHTFEKTIPYYPKSIGRTFEKNVPVFHTLYTKPYETEYEKYPTSYKYEMEDEYSPFTPYTPYKYSGQKKHTTKDVPYSYEKNYEKQYNYEPTFQTEKETPYHTYSKETTFEPTKPYTYGRFGFAKKYFGSTEEKPYIY
jgi:hypothetical protein